MPPETHPSTFANPEHGWATLRRFLPYLWPKGEPSLRTRVVIAMMMVLGS